jgi:hypothetical protein
MPMMLRALSLMCSVLLVLAAGPSTGAAQREQVWATVRTVSGEDVASFELGRGEVVRRTPNVTVFVKDLPERWVRKDQPPKGPGGEPLIGVRYRGRVQADVVVLEFAAVEDDGQINSEGRESTELILTREAWVGETVTINEVRTWGIAPLTVVVGRRK